MSQDGVRTALHEPVPLADADLEGKQSAQLVLAPPSEAEAAPRDGCACYILPRPGLTDRVLWRERKRVRQVDAYQNVGCLRSSHEGDSASCIRAQEGVGLWHTFSAGAIAAC